MEVVVAEFGDGGEDVFGRVQRSTGDVVDEQVVDGDVEHFGEAHEGISGQAVTLSATVSSSMGTPTGTVSFSTGGAVLGQGALLGGTASISTTALPVGADRVVASYSGSANFGASSSVRAVCGVGRSVQLEFDDNSSSMATIPLGTTPPPTASSEPSQQPGQAMG